MLNWLAGMLVFSHSCGLVGSAMFGPAATAALCLKNYSCLPSHNEWIVECFLLGSDLKVSIYYISYLSTIFFPNSSPLYPKSSACYVRFWNEATLLVELTPLCSCLKVRRAWQRERATERAQHVMQVSLFQPKEFRIFYLSG